MSHPAVGRRGLLALLLASVSLASCDHYLAADAGGSATPALTPAPHAPRASACGAIRTSDPDVVVDTLRDGTGNCVPPARIVLARCDPSFDPIALFDLSGAPRTFLGGRYAVTVHAVPDGATALGVTGAGRVWTVPGDDRALYVEAASTVERWLAVPHERVLDQPVTAHMIGDSVLDGASTPMTEALPAWSVTIDAVVGRGSYDAAAAAEAMPDPLPDVVVVEIGVNDASASSFAANLQRVLARVEHTDLVMWVTAHGPKPVTDEVNRAIVAGMGAIPNGAVADWDAFVPPDQLNSDGVHPAPGSEALLAELVAPLLDGWREAAAGLGPASCAGPITAAAVG